MLVAVIALFGVCRISPAAEGGERQLHRAGLPASGVTLPDSAC